MIRIKQTHGTGPATYHYWNGVTPIHDTPPGWGDIVSSAVPIITANESEFQLLDNFADAVFIADEQDRRQIPDP